MPYELFCGRSGQPLVLVFLREKFEEKKMHGNLPGETTWLHEAAEREKGKEKRENTN